MNESKNVEFREKTAKEINSDHQNTINPLNMDIEENKEQVLIPHINTNNANIKIAEESKIAETKNVIGELKSLLIENKEITEKEEDLKECEINFKIKSSEEILQKEKKSIVEEKLNEVSQIENSEIKKVLEPEQIVVEVFDRYFNGYFNDEIGTISHFMKFALELSKYYRIIY